MGGYFTKLVVFPAIGAVVGRVVLGILNAAGIYPEQTAARV